MDFPIYPDTPCPIRLVCEVEDGKLYHYWSLSFEENLKDAWTNLRSWLHESETRSPESNHWENRQEQFMIYKKLIKKIWSPLSPNFREYYRHSSSIYAIIPSYRTLCLDFYYKRLSYAFNNGPPSTSFKSKIIDSLETEKEDAVLFRLMDDDFLADMWEEYGLDTLKKVRFPSKPKVSEIESKT